MYYQLSEALTHKFIEELRLFWSYHANYQDLVNNIQGKYSFEERPQYGMIVKFTSANPQSLSADNFMGHLHSYVSLRKVGQYAGLSLEWVIEDSVSIQNNRGYFPSPAGVYFLDIQKESHDKFIFYVDPLLEVKGEILRKGTNILKAGKFHPKSLRIYSTQSNSPLKESVDFTANPTTGEVVITDEIFTDSYKAWYRYAGESTGPHEAPILGANNSAIKGCVLTFGRHITHDDKLAVVITDQREPCAREYGGRWTGNIEIEIISRDIYEQKEITDRTLLFILSTLRPKFSTQGIEIMEVSHGGETEEIADATGEDFFYNASLSVSVETEWLIHVPVIGTIMGTQAITSASQFTLAPFTDPFFLYPRYTSAQLK